MVGSIGTVVELLLLRKNNNTQRVVRLSRAPLEYWALYDANAEWQTKHNALREKNKQNEALSFKYKLLAEDLQKRVKELDETVRFPPPFPQYLAHPKRDRSCGRLRRGLTEHSC